MTVICQANKRVSLDIQQRGKLLNTAIKGECEWKGEALGKGLT